MMNINALVDRVAVAIRQALPQEVSVIGAYPETRKPTVIERSIVAVGLESAELFEESLDDDTKSGELCVFADIFIPASKKSGTALDIFTKICDCLDEFNILAISAGRVEYSKMTSAFVMKTSYRLSPCLFDDNFNFGGEDSAGGISTGRGAQ